MCPPIPLPGISQHLRKHKRNHYCVCPSVILVLLAFIGIILGCDLYTSMWVPVCWTGKIESTTRRIKVKCAGETAFRSFISLCPLLLCPIMLLLSLCLTLLQKAINLGQACGSVCLHHSGKELGVPAEFLLVPFIRALKGTW